MTHLFNGTTLDQLLLTSFASFGRRKEAKSVWQCAMYATVWSIWLEHNSHTFKVRFSDKHVLWDRVRPLASIWCKALNLFRGVSLTYWKIGKLCFIDSFFICLLFVFALVTRISCPPTFLYFSSLLLNNFFFYPKKKKCYYYEKNEKFVQNSLWVKSAVGSCEWAELFCLRNLFDHFRNFVGFSSDLVALCSADVISSN